MNEVVYEVLRAHLDSFPTGFPKTEDCVELAILRELFSEEEAKIATKLPLMGSGLPKGSVPGGRGA